MCIYVHVCAWGTPCATPPEGQAPKPWRARGRCACHGIAASCQPRRGLESTARAALHRSSQCQGFDILASATEAASTTQHTKAPLALHTTKSALPKATATAPSLPPQHATKCCGFPLPRPSSVAARRPAARPLLSVRKAQWSIPRSRRTWCEGRGGRGRGRGCCFLVCVLVITPSTQPPFTRVALLVPRRTRLPTSSRPQTCPSPRSVRRAGWLRGVSGFNDAPEAHMLIPPAAVCASCAHGTVPCRWVLMPA